MLTLEQMTPEQKLGRVLCFRSFIEEDDIEFALELVKNQACGCVQIPFNQRTKELIAKYREAAEYSLLIINDMEEGLPLSTLPKIPFISLAACNNPEYTKVFAAAIAKEAKEMGYSGCWSPIVDMLHENKPCGVSRSPGDNPEAVSKIAKDILEVFASYNFSGAAKHYPSCPCGPVDTHMIEGVSKITEEELLNGPLVPYLELMKAGVMPSIMTGHEVLLNIDPDHPASLSKKVLDLLRDRGFDGVMFTDSLAMMGILQKFGQKDSMAIALMAGNDLLVTNIRRPNREIYEDMVQAYKEGKITDERLDEAVRRVMRLEEYCAREPENPYPLPENAEEILNNIARDCITADCEEGVSPAIDPDEERLFVIITPQDYSYDAEAGEIYSGDWYSPHAITLAINERFPNAAIKTMREFPTARENSNLLLEGAKYKKIVIVSYCDSYAYLGSDNLTRRMESVINALIHPGRVEAIVHFGNPLALENLYPVKRKIYAYKSPSSTPYAFDVLAGKIPAKGKHPFPNLVKKANLAKHR
ncbi:MAG: hypothetical protein IKC34_01070 [Clostridia bacterium]|nr:hypothetical protein [Clostridia bacterium]